MVEKMVRAVTAIDPKCKFTFARAKELYEEEISKIRFDQQQKLGKVWRAHHVRQCDADIEKFLRACGFRRVGTTDWFCLATDATHPSHSLTPDEDYNPPDLQLAAAAIDFHVGLSALNGSACKEQLMIRTREQDPNLNPIWTALSYDNNTVLHRMQWYPNQRNDLNDLETGLHYGPFRPDRYTRTESLRWILSQPFVEPLLSIVNWNGVIPIEKYQSFLEETRTLNFAGGMTVHVSDMFTGHTEDEARCLFDFQRRTPT